MVCPIFVVDKGENPDLNRVGGLGARTHRPYKTAHPIERRRFGGTPSPASTNAKAHPCGVFLRFCGKRDPKKLRFIGGARNDTTLRHIAIICLNHEKLGKIRLILQFSLKIVMCGIGITPHIILFYYFIAVYSSL